MKRRLILDLLTLVGAAMGLSVLLLFAVARGVEHDWTSVIFSVGGLVALGVMSSPICRDLGQTLTALDAAFRAAETRRQAPR